MAESARHTVRYALIEIFIVSVGILIAFSLDSWWQARLDRSREQVYLEQLRADFTVNVETLRESVARESRIKEGSLGLLRAIRASPPPPAADIGREMSKVFDSGRPLLAMGTYRTLVSTGDLTLLRDAALRQDLAAFASLLESTYSERHEDDLYQRMLGDASGRLDLLGHLPAATLAALQIPASAANWDPRSLLNDARFVDQLTSRFGVADLVERHYTVAAGRAQSILERIDGSHN